MAATTFPSFPKLPWELRNMVWGYAMDNARRAELHSDETQANRRTNRMHFFTIFDRDQEHLVPINEQLHNQALVLHYFLGAPRTDPRP